MRKVRSIPIGLILVAVAFLSACSTTKSKLTENSTLTEAPLPGLDETESKVIVEEILHADAVFGKNQKESPPKERSLSPESQLATVIARDALKKRQSEPTVTVERIPLELNKRVAKWIRFFTEKDRERFQRFLNNGARYRALIMKTLKKYGVPEDLYYLALIESGFHNHARSRASAVGMWQFIHSTGKLYGLDVDYYIDERRDPVRATEAAARHFKDLYRRYDSWYLALAAYNSGIGRVNGAIRRGRSKNYWRLVEKRVLPRETRNYVPKFLAAMTIGHHPKKFGFEVEVENEFPAVQSVKVPSPIRLSHVAKVTKVPLEHLKKVNPHIRRGITPYRLKKYDLWIPIDYHDQAVRTAGQLAQYRISSRDPHRGYASRSWHRVRRGETLSHIARRYRTSIRRIQDLNGLSGGRIYAGQKIRISTAAPQRSIAGKYRARRGETLSGIARKHRMSLSALKSLNGLRSSRVYAGQRLRVRSAVRKSSGSQRYRVRKGDTLWEIAQRFGVSIQEIKRNNRLHRNLIRPGQVINI